MLCEDHKPITFEAYLGNLRKHILRRLRSAIGAAGYIESSNIHQISSKDNCGSYDSPGNQCDCMWSLNYRQVAYYSITNSYLPRFSCKKCRHRLKRIAERHTITVSGRISNGSIPAGFNIRLPPTPPISQTYSLTDSELSRFSCK